MAWTRLAARGAIGEREAAQGGRARIEAVFAALEAIMVGVCGGLAAGDQQRRDMLSYKLGLKTQVRGVGGKKTPAVDV